MSAPHRGARYDVVGIGNALVDIIAQADDAFLDREALVKGSMMLIETERAVGLYAALGSAVEMSGGSAANTMTGIASFGGRAAYVGKVADDDLGRVFGHDLRAVGVQFRPGARHTGEHMATGRCIIVVTPDAQRTMNTYLGMSSLLHPDDIDQDTVADGQVLYMEGYLFDRPDAKEAFWLAADVAHRNGRKVSLTLSDTFCVERHHDDFRQLVAERVDILFGNEHELCSLYDTDDFDDALDRVRGDLDMAVITCGADGSVIATGDGIVRVTVEPVEQVLDTTGAGDLYAAGFLYGYTHGKSLTECGRLGSLAAAEVIGHMGPRPLVDLRTLV